MTAFDIKTLPAEIQQRAIDAQAVNPSRDVWTGGACDMLRIAAFAGFDVGLVMRLCFYRTAKSKASRINARTVENVMGEYSDAYDSLERDGLIT